MTDSEYVCSDVLGRAQKWNTLTLTKRHGREGSSGGWQIFNSRLWWSCSYKCYQSRTPDHTSNAGTPLPPLPLVLPHPRDGHQVTVPHPPPGEPHYHRTCTFAGTEIAANNERIQHKIRSKGCQCTETYSLTSSV